MSIGPPSGSFFRKVWIHPLSAVFTQPSAAPPASSVAVSASDASSSGTAATASCAFSPPSATPAPPTSAFFAVSIMSLNATNESSVRSSSITAPVRSCAPADSTYVGSAARKPPRSTAASTSLPSMCASSICWYCWCSTVYSSLFSSAVGSKTSWFFAAKSSSIALKASS